MVTKKRQTTGAGSTWSPRYSAWSPRYKTSLVTPRLCNRSSAVQRASQKIRAVLPRNKHHVFPVLKEEAPPQAARIPCLSLSAPPSPKAGNGAAEQRSEEQRPSE